MESIVNDPIFWLVACVALAFVRVGWKTFAKSKNIPEEPVESIIEGAEQYSEDKYKELEAQKEALYEEGKKNQGIIEETVVTDISEPPVKKKRKRGAWAVPMILMVFLTSCIPGLWNKENIEDGIELVKYFTTNKDSAKVKMPTDSIVIKFNPVYIKIKPYTGNIENERDSILNGYRIWELETPNFRRTEVQKLDSVIYFYKK